MADNNKDIFPESDAWAAHMSLQKGFNSAALRGRADDYTVFAGLDAGFQYPEQGFSNRK